MSLSNALEYKKLPILPPILGQTETQALKIIAYCLMPDHYHLLLKLYSTDVLSKYIGDVENSYTRYLNIKRRRKGPLWQSRFVRVSITKDSQLAHVSRYIHLNPVTSYLCNKPEDWAYSSYRLYIKNAKIFSLMNEFSFKSVSTYRKFVEDQIDYQRKLRMIKKHLI